MKSVCKKCGKVLSSDEIALYRRLIYRDAEEYLCIECLAEEMRVLVPALEEKIAYFKEIGCTLF